MKLDEHDDDLGPSGALWWPAVMLLVYATVWALAWLAK